MNNTSGDRERFALVLWGIAEDFGGELSDQGLEMRFRALQEFSIEQIEAAGTWLLTNREKTFPAVPSTKEMIDVIKGFTVPRVKSVSQAEIQVDKVLAKLKYHGRAGVADFEDPITQHLMEIRWPYRSWASTVTEKDLVWWRKEFITSYQAHFENQKAKKMVLDAPGKNNSQMLKLAGACAKRMG